MGTLCQRMTEDLKLKNYAPATCSEYLRCAKQFAAYHMRSPAEMGEREIRDFLLSLAFEHKGVATGVGGIAVGTALDCWRSSRSAEIWTGRALMMAAVCGGL
jgi:hypothetical protein